MAPVSVVPCNFSNAHGHSRHSLARRPSRLVSRTPDGARLEFAPFQSGPQILLPESGAQVPNAASRARPVGCTIRVPPTQRTSGGASLRLETTATTASTRSSFLVVPGKTRSKTGSPRSQISVWQSARCRGYPPALMPLFRDSTLAQRPGLRSRL